MTAKCIHNSGSELGPPAKGGFYTSKSVFHLKIGAEYEILGLGIFWATLSTLVCDETGKPNWLPTSLFEVGPQALPARWEFALRGPPVAEGDETPDRWVALWGYPELVRNASHSDLLVERDADALQLFYRELAEQSSHRA